MKRTFIAVKVEAGKKLAEIVEILKTELKGETIRWVDTSKMHITLAFTGDTSEETIKSISEMLGNKCSGMRGFEFGISGLGIFRNINDPRVIWAGIDNSPELEELFGDVKKGLDEIGVPVEERNFKPHLTLGRIKWIKNRKTLEGLLIKYVSEKLQTVKINEVIFFESILQETGPLYLPIKIFKLK